MRPDQFRFTKADIGCWIDGSRGNQGTLERLNGMIQSIAVTFGDYDASRLVQRYANLDPDSELTVFWAQDCTAQLQRYTEDGLVWEWEAGDLTLIEDIYDEVQTT